MTPGSEHIKCQRVSHEYPMPRSFKEVFFSSSKLVMMYHERAWHPPTDVYETPAEIVVKCELAGVRPTEVMISLEGGRLTVRGVRLHWERYPKRTYRLMEINYGDFTRTIELHHPVVIAQARATYHEGFLEIVLPKSVGSKHETPVSGQIKINLEK